MALFHGQSNLQDAAAESQREAVRAFLNYLSGKMDDGTLRAPDGQVQRRHLEFLRYEVDHWNPYPGTRWPV